MSSEYDYNAPQFLVNFEESTDGDDDFFDAKDGSSKSSIEAIKSPLKNAAEHDSENKENIPSDEENELNNSFSQIKIKGNKFDGIELAVEEDRKSHPMLTRQDVSILSPKLSLQLRSRSVLKDVLVAEEERNMKRKRASSPYQGKNIAKYQSLSEAMYHFQRDTPPRFRSKPRNTVFEGKSSKEAGPSSSKICVPNTPHFLSDARLRKCNHSELTQEERELQDIQQAKEQFKRVELNKKIFNPVKEVEREKKFTVPQPFHITNFPTKKPVEEKKDEVFQFKARPVPTYVYNPRMMRIPVIMEDIEGENGEDMASNVLGYKEAQPRSTTRVKPFSFDLRDKLSLQKKQEKIEKIKEEERKLSVFKAQPIPASLHLDNDPDRYSCGGSSTTSHHCTEMNDFHPDFRARDARVLRKKPFQPKKSEKAPTKVEPFNLALEQRVAHRLEFDMNTKRNIEENEERWKLEAEKREQEEIKELRKDLVHKARPVPSYICKSKSSSREDIDDSNTPRVNTEQDDSLPSTSSD